MANIETAIICFHDESESKIEWLREKLSQAIGLNPKCPHQATELNHVAQFLDIKVETDKRNQLYSVSDVEEVEDGYAIYLHTENAGNCDMYYWEAFSLVLGIQHARKEEVDGEVYIEGDPYSFYFKEECCFDSWDESGSGEFLCVEDLLTYLENKFPNGAFLCKRDVLKWNKYLRENSFGAIRMYERSV